MNGKKKGRMNIWEKEWMEERLDGWIGKTWNGMVCDECANGKKKEKTLQGLTV